MAYVMQLKQQDVPGMDRILNVSKKVGPRSDCINAVGDVEAVQRLVAAGCRKYAGNHGFGLPLPTGTLDALTGFYIFESQYKRKSTGAPGTVVDGCVSPAHGVAYGGGVWTIVQLNAYAFSYDRAAWEAILSRFAGNAPGT